MVRHWLSWILLVGLVLAAAPSAAAPKERAVPAPDAPEMQQQAPKVFRAALKTTKGTIVIEVHRDSAPLGADRFYNLVRHGFYDGTRFFRVVDGFIAQFGISGEPPVAAAWKEAKLADDPVVQSNRRGTVSFAMAGPRSRTTQLFINLRDNPYLDGIGFAPFGRVVSGMSVVDQLYSGYGEGAPRGQGPSQQRIELEGTPYLERDFPKLDFIQRGTIAAPPK